MPVNVSVKNVPDVVIEKLRKRAKRHHRSLQGELLSILEDATNAKSISVEDAELLLNELSFKTGDDSGHWVRELRDAR